MGLASFGFGYFPLTLKTSSTARLKLFATFGAGLLLGAAFLIIIPEGVETIYRAEEEMRIPGDIRHSSTVNRDIGLSMLLGFAFMLVVDQFGELLSGSMQHQPIPISVQDLRSPDYYTPAPTIGFLIHAAADGIALGAAFSTGQVKMQIVVFVAIMLHKGPSAFGLATFLLSKGLHRSLIIKNLLMFSAAAPLSALFTFSLIAILDSGDGILLKYRTGLVLLFSAGIS